MRLTIKARLLGCLIALTVGAAAIGITGLASTSTANQEMRSVINDRVVPLQQLKLVSDSYAVSIVDTAHKALSGSVAPDVALQRIRDARAAIKTNWAGYAATDMTPQEKILVDQTEAALPAANTAADELEQLLGARDMTGLRTFNDQKLYPAIDPVTNSVDGLVNLQIRVAREDGASAARAAIIANLVMGAVALFALGLLCVAAWVVVRQVSGPLLGLASVMRRLAGGDNEVAVPGTDRHDELGQMAASVLVFKENAIAKLKADAEIVEQKARAEAERKAAQEAAIAQEQALVVSSFGAALEKLAEGDLTYRVTQDLPVEYEKLRADFNGAMTKLDATMQVIVGNAASIRSSSHEITSASDDLAKRTEQQAAGLEETAAALDEITTTLHKTADGASEAQKVVASTKSGAETSGQVVSQAIQAMSAIESSAREINQIIGVIDEIAFQTNLLALNAGVEAARAGDAGKGFAVVASEVRALAQRSAEAAKEIKALISTSSTQVDQGVRLVGETGKALTRIVSEVAQINDLVTDIAGSAQEQSTGVKEINVAVNQMDQVTQQNAAMVEQATAASHSLAKEADNLTQLMGQFRLDPAGSLQAAPQAARPRADMFVPQARRPAATRMISTGSAQAKPDTWEEF